MLQDLVDKLEQDAAKLGFSAIYDSKGKRIGIAERTLSATEIIKHHTAVLAIGFESDDRDVLRRAML